MTKKRKVPDKTKEQILEQLYITADDLQVLIPEISYSKALKYIKEAREEMEEKKYVIPGERPMLALTKLVRKKFGF